MRRLPAGIWQTHYEGFVTLFKPWAWVNTSAAGSRLPTLSEGDTTLGEMNASDKTHTSRIPKEVSVGTMSREQTRFQENGCSIFHLGSKSNCSGVLVCLPVNMRQRCDVGAKNKQTNSILGFIIRKTAINKGGGGK